jgi:ribosomal protein S20
MIQNPADADKIAKASEYTNDSIKKSAYVNRADRQKLDWMINRNDDSLNLKAAQTTYEQNKRNIANQYWDSYPTAMKQATDALNKGDMKTAEIVLETLHKNAQAAASIGAISPEQLGKIHTTTLQMYDRASGLIDAMNNPNGMTAEQYHAATGSPFASNSLDQIGQPVDHNTQWMAQHYQSDRTVQGQFNALYSGQPINVGVMAGASDAEYQKFVAASQGVNYVKGSIAAGTPFNLIQSRINAIMSKPTALTPTEEGAVNYWKNFNNRLATDNAFYGVLGQTVLGQQYAANHTAQAESLRSTKTGVDLQNALKQNDNDYIGQNISLSHALHMDYHYIKPIPSEWINEVKSSFQKDAPVLPALQRLEYINPEYRAYLADAMPRPHQGVAVWVAGLTLGKTDSSFQADLIHANQEDVSPLAQMDKKGGAALENEKTSLMTSAKESVGTKPENIWNDIVNNNDDMKAVYTYMAKMPGGGTSQDGFRQMAINYEYDQAQRAGDYNLENKDQYIKNFTTNIEKGFNLYRNDRAIINLSDIPIARTQDVDHLTSYVLSEAYKRLHVGKTESEFQASIDLNPLMVVSTPDHRLVAIDRYGRAAVTTDGHEAFDMPYTSKMLAAAQANSKTVADYMRNYGMNEAEENPTENGGYPITPQDIMLKEQNKRERAKAAKHREQRVLQDQADAKARGESTDQGNEE